MKVITKYKFLSWNLSIPFLEYVPIHSRFTLSDSIIKILANGFMFMVLMFVFVRPVCDWQKMM